MSKTANPMFEVVAPCGVSNEFESRQKAEEGVDTHEALCEECEEGSAEIKAVGETAETDGGPQANATAPKETESVDEPPAAVPEPTEPEAYENKLPDDGPSVDEDPLVWMPDEFTDEIDDTIAINRKGFEVLAHHYDIQCSTELVVGPHDTEYSYAVVRAVANDADGDEYTAFGEAHTDEKDMKKTELTRYADTRAYKRAISRATGVGMVAVEELQAGL